MDKYIGKKLEGRYEIRELVGVGGMANVYKGYDVVEDRTVAIKILRDEFLDNEEFLHRFRNEFRAISLLNHPNIVQVYDVSFTSKIQCIVMEYIDGITLKEYIEQEGVIRWKEAVHFSIQVLRGLQHAHDRGIVHRDIKPQNLMLLSDGTIKITDFGIARFSRSSTNTITTKAIGSVHYISPEQASGGATDARADLYSIGVLLFEMLTGKLPFDADSPVSVAIKQIQSTPTLPTSLNPNIPKGLEEIVMKAMQKDVGRRYQSAAEMLRDIDSFKKDPSIVFEYRYLETESVEERIQKEFHKQGVSDDMKRRKNSQKEEEYERKPLPLVPAMFAIAMAFFVVCCAFVVMLFVENKPFEVKPDVVVPDLLGASYEDIEDKKLYSEDFKIVLESSDYNSQYEEGDIYYQNPSANTILKQGDTIRVKVSLGQNVIVVKDYTNRDSADVFRELNKEGIQYEEMTAFSDTIPSGHVIRTEPAASEEFSTDEVMMVYVSQGPQETKVSVPPLEGMDLNTAKSLLMSYRLRIANIEEVSASRYDDKAPGTIVEQDPPEGTMVAAGSSVDIKVIEGINEENKMTVRIPVESDIDERVYIEAYIGEEKVASKRITPEDTSSWRFSLSGNGRVVMEIYLDRELYRVYGLDFVEEKLYDITDDPESFETSSGTTGIHVSGSELSEGVEELLNKKDEEGSEDSEE
ncbi:MAG: Stk1 family PASTA domain-containing Ser/Thr kinase [Oscillospiraceae bacterium]|nr:Stk1 family PASTA domain-containing Ser/Thr kinase [Oscillospiraceae bacterium]